MSPLTLHTHKNCALVTRRPEPREGKQTVAKDRRRAAGRRVLTQTAFRWQKKKPSSERVRGKGVSETMVGTTPPATPAGGFGIRSSGQGQLHICKAQHKMQCAVYYSKSRKKCHEGTKIQTPFPFFHSLSLSPLVMVIFICYTVSITLSKEKSKF